MLLIVFLLPLRPVLLPYALDAVSIRFSFFQNRGLHGSLPSDDRRKEAE